ncbi:hypothetical protein [Actinophytocola gossypii]|uniref:Uncharacterized protein n=1 Tax=Actinophytocola gossypii TaxID=2812003 RepID=A0ABT2J407_9PSEU|nr:hypothetical protein [Actinophytocola gossypii]MCT2582513.1 hypothetical protein [Actinophytocola gossypii]
MPHDRRTSCAQHNPRWNAQRPIERHPHTVEPAYRELVEVITPATVVHDVLQAELPRARTTLEQLPALDEEFHHLPRRKADTPPRRSPTSSTTLKSERAPVYRREQAGDIG